MSEYDDVKFLLDHGTWKDLKIPDWAEKESKRLRTEPASSVILMNAMRREIERLRRDNREMRELLETACVAAETNGEWTCLDQAWFVKAEELSEDKET